MAGIFFSFMKRLLSNCQDAITLIEGRRLEPLRDIFYDKSVFVIGDMVIIKELCKIFRIFTGHGVARTALFFNACSRASCSFTKSLAGCMTDAHYKQNTSKYQKKYRKKKQKPRKIFFIDFQKFSVSPPYIAKSERIPRSGIITESRTSPTSLGKAGSQ